MDCMKARGISMMKAQTFSATPTPAEATRPRLFTIAKITRNDRPTSRSCRAIGVPKARIFRRMAGKRRKSRRSREKGSSRLCRIAREISTLIVWAQTVAMAAPAAPRPSPATSSRSPAMLQALAIATVTRGVWESPRPRRTLPSTL